MRAPAFWWTPRPSWPALLLAPVAWIYGRVAAARLARRGEAAPIPVVCVGNLVAGGAGKTPVALALARRLRGRGLRPVFLSRGYGGRLPGPVVVDPASHGAAEVGDEPLLLAARAPVVVSRDRPAGARLAATLGDVLVMDDGLQNPSLHKDLRLAVVDGAVGLGNGFCIPAGPLRAPLPDQWPLVDALVIVGQGRAGDDLAAVATARGKPVLRARLVPDAASAARVAGRRVLAFAGIGRPEKFFASLTEAGAQRAGERVFPDHHPFTAAQIEALLAQARTAGLLPVTTAKDMARIHAVCPQAEQIAQFEVDLVFEEPGQLDALLAGLHAGGAG